MKLLAVFILGALFNALAAFFSKIGFSRIFDSNFVLQSVSLESLKFISGGLFCFTASFIFYGLALSRVNLGIAQPIFTCLTMAMVLLLSTIILKESIHALHALGLTFMLVGVVLVSQT
jgi:multidrug transporter EmrE-like cation transporter